MDVASRVLRWLRRKSRSLFCNSAPTEHSRAREDPRSHIIEMASFLHYILYKGTRLRTGKGKRRAAGDFSVFRVRDFRGFPGFRSPRRANGQGGRGISFIFSSVGGVFLYIFLQGRGFPLYFLCFFSFSVFCRPLQKFAPRARAP